MTNKTVWQPCDERELLTYHNKGFNAAQVTKMILKREPTKSEVDRITKKAIKMGITLNSRKKSC